MRICIGLLVFASAVGSYAQTLTVFGDSLSDSGLRPVGGGIAQWIQTTLQTNEVYPQPPYSNGRYSNGPVWVDYVSQNLGINYINWAAGGAVSGAGISQTGPLPAGFAGFPTPVTVLAPNIHQQVDQYLAVSNNTANSSDIFVIFIGNNDYFSIASTRKNITADEVVENIEEAMDKLYTRGARSFILVTIPSVVVLPTSLLTYGPLVQAWTEHNPLLREMGSDFNSSHPGSTVSIFDFESVVYQIIGSPAKYGFTSAASCYPVSQEGAGLEAGTMPCSNPAAHFLWDRVHPTTTAHAIVGSAFASQFAPLWGLTYSLGPAPAPAPFIASN